MSASLDVRGRALTASDRRWVRTTLVREWTSTAVARRGELIDATRLRGFVALVGGKRAGLALVDVRDGDYEVVAISTSRPRRGVGRALMQQCVDDARALGCRRLWLVTTNDNVGAIAFYERFGMRLCAVHRGAVDEARALKSSIPRLDGHGVPIDDELEFELDLPR
jgi:ribosomal protein S18 acetylase RimI-like enzyme